MAAGYFPGLLTGLSWILYLSLVSVGREFLSYQWDTLLLEIGFLAIFICPWNLQRKPNETPSTFVVLLFRILAFKLEFSSGVVKLASGDPSWRDYPRSAFTMKLNRYQLLVDGFSINYPTFFTKFRRR
jgi:lipase maturation factor 1